MNKNDKKIIDDMPYREMFSLRRFAPVGHRYFLDNTGEYFMKIMAEKRMHITDAEYTQISKSVGWG